MRFFWAVVFGLLATTAQAASFDCAKAATQIERAICSSPDLSRLDEAMAATYKKALKAQKYAPYLRDDQKAWLENDRAADVATFESRARFLTAFARLASCLDGLEEPAACALTARETLDTCMSDGQYTTYAMDTCSSAMAGAWDAVLDVETALQRRSLADDPETQVLYDDATAAFDTYRAAECGWRYSQYRDGTIRGQIWFGCYLDLTSRRAISAVQSNQMF